MKKKEINKKDKNSSLLNKAEEHLDKSEYTVRKNFFKR